MSSYCSAYLSCFTFHFARAEGIPHRVVVQGTLTIIRSLGSFRDCSCILVSILDPKERYKTSFLPSVLSFNSSMVLVLTIVLTLRVSRSILASIFALITSTFAAHNLHNFLENRVSENDICCGTSAVAQKIFGMESYLLYGPRFAWRTLLSNGFVAPKSFQSLQNSPKYLSSATQRSRD